MAFSELIKIQVRKKAHMSCCLCKTFGVEIHHIIPVEEDGPDTEENAAPLCPACHEIYGANPKKRKMIREARDLWYEVCSKRFNSNDGRIDELVKHVKELPNLLSSSVAAAVISKLKNQKSQIPKGRKKQKGWPLHKLIGKFLSLTAEGCGVSKSGAQFTYQLLFEVGVYTDDFAEIKNIFLKKFGELMAQKFCIYFLKSNPFNFSGFTEKEYGDFMFSALIAMTLLLSHEELDVFEELKFSIRLDSKLEMIMYK
jgi:HNH endonuclease